MDAFLHSVSELKSSLSTDKVEGFLGIIYTISDIVFSYKTFCNTRYTLFANFGDFGHSFLFEKWFELESLRINYALINLHTYSY